MKNKRKVLISSLILGSLILGIGCRRNLPPDPFKPEVENVEIKKEKEPEPEKKKVRIKSEDELVFEKHIEIFKDKELILLKERYDRKIRAINHEESGIDTQEITLEEYEVLKQKYYNETGSEGTPYDAIMLEALQEYENEIVFLENYIENKMDIDILTNDKPIVIWDDALNTAIEKELGESDEFFYFKEFSKIKNLDFNGSTIEDLEGLEYAINLENIDLGNVQIDGFKVLEPLRLLQNLKTVNLLGTFKYMDSIPLNYLAESVEYVGLEDYGLGAEYNFKIINETKNLETTTGGI